MRAVLFGVALFSALMLVRGVPADPPEGKGKPQPLTSKKLSGTWRGAKEGVKVLITFRGADDATWQVNNENATVGASLKRVDDKKSGTVHLRQNYVETATGKRGSAVLGRLGRDASGTLRLTILPAATKVTAEYKPVERIPLTEIKDKKR
jgi:hypothetical protein